LRTHHNKSYQSTEQIQDEAELNLLGIPSMSNISQNDAFISGRRPGPMVVSSDLSREITALKNNRLVDNRKSEDHWTENSNPFEKSINAHNER